MRSATSSLSRTDVSLLDVLQGTVAPYENRARAAGARIELDVKEESARVDPARLRQAVANLLENALRHSGAGGVILVRAARDGSSVAISVQDSGPGFPTDLLERAFEPFARSDGGDPDGAGAGLGLTIVRAVAQAHGGTAQAENLPQGGARVSFSLPG